MGRERSHTVIRNVVTTQRTGKFWKLLQLVGLLTTLVSVGWLVGIYGLLPENGSPEDLSDASMSAAKVILVGAVGLATWITGRIGGWWFHG